EEVCKALKEAAEAIRLLVRVATQIRTRRLKRGGLELDSIEVSVRFEDQKSRSGRLEDLIPSEHLEMHSTVAELMIFANHWVARRCLERFPARSCLRRHPAPKPEHFDELRQCAASKGFNIDADTNQSLANSLNSAVDPNDGEVNSILRQLATRAMTNALYFSTGSDALTQEDFAHYGLALNLYTHFTSPIRRYADVIVHRLLMASISDDGGNAADDLFSSADLDKVCDVMNSLHWSAQQAQRCSIELFQAMFFRQMQPQDPGRFLDAIICQLRGSNGFTVQVSRFGIRGSISVKKSDGSVAWITDTHSRDQSNKVEWKSASEGYQVERVKPSSDENIYGFLQVSKPGSSNKQIYRLFDHVKVYVDVRESTAHGVTLHLTLAGLADPPVAKPAAAENDGKKLDEGLIKAVREEDSSRQKKRRMETNMDVDQEDESEQVQRSKLIASSLHDSRSSFWKIRHLIQDSQQ
ncbi:DIS3 mitotic control, partial [Cichlidogyrus casuarinus]